MHKQILDNELSIGNTLLKIITSSSNFLSNKDLLYFSSVQFSLVMTLVMLITFPAMSMKRDDGSRIYLNVIRTKYANNLQLTKCWKVLHNANRFSQNVYRYRYSF